MLIACLEENNKPKQQQILEMIKARFEYLTK
jgi:hypothetical protein